MFGPTNKQFSTNAPNLLTRYDCVSAISGFAYLPSEDGIEVQGATDQAKIRFNAQHPYFQAEISFPEKNGWMELRHEGALLDRAQLVGGGWIKSAVETKGAPIGAELTLHFVDDEGSPVDGVNIRSMHLSDEWGLGERSRLRCLMPFTFMAIGTESEATLCPCGTWRTGDPSLGNARDTNIADLWNSPAAQKMRASFHEGNYAETCRQDVCLVLSGAYPVPELDNPELVKAINEKSTALQFGPSIVRHDVDRGCNLECNMCRDFKILPDQSNVDQAVEDIKQAVELGSLVDIGFSGAGEVFIMSKIVRLLESDLFSSRGIGVRIITNLTHFNAKLWDRIKHNHFKDITISADGCTPEIYENIRTGARWKNVLANMHFLSGLARCGQIDQICWNYTVQRSNIADIGKAIQLSRALGFAEIRMIGQVGVLERTDGNMFEEFDRPALDALYAELESAQAFGDPRVKLDELGMRDHFYQTREYRLGLARYFWDRATLYGGEPVLAALPMLTGLWRDEKSGAVKQVEGVPTHFAPFINQLLSELEKPKPIRERARVWLGLLPSSDYVTDEMLKWLKSLAILATPPSLKSKRVEKLS